jgi:two-component system, LytTR family, sensor kinase
MMESADNQPNKGHLDTRMVLLSIIGFWIFYFLIVTLRTWVVDYPAQGEMASRRGIVTAMGIAVTVLQWVAMRPFDGRSLVIRILTAAAFAIPCALAIDVFNYYVFNVYDPEGMLDVENLKPPPEFQPSPLVAIAELAIGRYFFLIAWAAFYLALGFAGEVRRAERRAAEFAQAAQTAELRALRYQVNPHFLFNTLNSLSALVMRGRRDEAEAMIMNLSTFYRTSLAGEPTEDVALIDEIALQRLYLDIEAVRFPKRLSVEIDLPSALKDAAVPGLILQPLVENAVKHGVSCTSQPVTLRIAAWECAERVMIEVHNSGPIADTKEDSEGHSIGIANVRDRLAARFGGEAQLEAGRTADGGWRALISLPKGRV